MSQSKKQSSQNAANLLSEAQQQGSLSKEALRALQTPDIGQQIQANLGVAADKVQASEVVLVTMILDDSGSIRFVQGNTEAVRDGANGVLGALDKAKKKSGILCHAVMLNGGALYPYCPLDQAVHLDSHNYNPTGGTPLYDVTAATLATVVAKCQEFENNGIPARAVTLIVTDGNDEGSRNQTAQTLSVVIGDLLRTEKHIVAAMGIDDHGGTNFRAVFQSMGIRDEWILTPANDPKEVRKAFQLFSQSAATASQAAKFSKTAAGGFDG